MFADVRSSPPPSGWTLVLGTDNSTTMRKVTYSHVLTAADPTKWTFGFSKAQSATGVLAAFGGVDVLNPVVASGGQINATANSVTAPSLTAMSGGTTIVGLFGVAASATITAPAGMAGSGSARAATGTYKVSSEIAVQGLATNTASGQKTAQSSASTAGTGQLIALQAG